MTNIAWTDALAVPMPSSVATDAQRLHVNPMDALVAEKVMVLTRATAAIEAGQWGGREQA